MRIIDIHAHTGKWSFYPGANDDCIQDLLDRHNIEKVVLSSGKALLDNLSEGNMCNYNFVNSDKRCYGYVVINPKYFEESENELVRYLGKEKIIGVKMHPAMFDEPVNSESSKKLLRIINSYGLPVLIHTEDTQTSRPMNILEIAHEFPDNKYIIAHMGNAWWQEALDTASKAKNIYTDMISSWCAFDQIRYACERVGDDHVLYGSDLSLLDPGFSIGTVLSSEISDESKEKIFYKNALQVFKF